MKKPIITFLSIIFIWLGGFLYFLHIINNYSNNNRNMTESIIVFGETDQNLLIATKLLKLGYAPIAFIADNQANKAKHTAFLQQQKLAPEQLIFDQTKSSSTYNHALNSILFMQKYDFHSTRIIAKSYQLPRALYALSKIAPSDIIIIPHPILSEGSNYYLAFKEYVKYTLFLVASFIGKENEFNLSYS